MAATIAVQTNLTISGSTAQVPAAARSSTVTQVGADVGSDTQDIASGSDSAVAVPASITGDRYLEVVNLDTTNYIQLSNATGGSFTGGVFSKVVAGTSVLIQPTGAIYAKANGATVRIQFRAIEA